MTAVRGRHQELVEVTWLAVERDGGGHVTGSGIDDDVRGRLSVDVVDRVYELCVGTFVVVVGLHLQGGSESKLLYCDKYFKR